MGELFAAEGEAGVASSEAERVLLGGAGIIGALWEGTQLGDGLFRASEQVLQGEEIGVALVKRAVEELACDGSELHGLQVVGDGVEAILHAHRVEVGVELFLFDEFRLGAFVMMADGVELYLMGGSPLQEGGEVCAADFDAGVGFDFVVGCHVCVGVLEV